ncbi:Erv1 / Alr family protein [Cryptosporidium muris RN66]|uniref:Sulfhydryl oxidase n=1 Tax=Cryptosporidium muris (strain RN66) TaxID=441375 RepID=B6ACM3_CRYMR|nr:Erv1 / Alr family protein [Cryptosporidium muris RN66]EEA05877.1 Erv1 / Alr family protein [Cryptosporidium muris RN66]|eukprot:XP_002140226.1 Erv1 / Alr family protein [Cryptosporidium muris RN66]
MFWFKKRIDEQCKEENCKDNPIDPSNLEFVENRRGKPPNTKEIGRATWLYLHTIANQYPINPTEQDIEEWSKWFNSFTKLYPCKLCRTGISKVIKNFPPRLSNRDDFILWVCEFHNLINKDLGIETKPCNIKKLIEMYP